MASKVSILAALASNLVFQNTNRTARHRNRCQYGSVKGSWRTEKPGFFKKPGFCLGADPNRIGIDVAPRIETAYLIVQYGSVKELWEQRNPVTPAKPGF